MAKKANRAEWLAQKRKKEAKKAQAQRQAKPKVRRRKSAQELKSIVDRGLREARRKHGLKARREERARADKKEQARRAEGIAVELERQELDSWRWSSPCSSPEPPVSHTWRLLDERSHPPRIWWGGLLLRTAGCVNCGIKAEFSEGAWDTTVALGDGPCVAWS